MVEVVDRLERFYGPLPFPPDDPFGGYVWDILGARTTSARRDAAIGALRRIPALTPDSLANAARGTLEQAVALAGPHRDERLRALAAGAAVFRRHRDFPERLRGGIAAAREVLAWLPHVGTVSSQWMLLFAGRYPMMPDDPHVQRVLARLQRTADGIADELGGVLTAIQRAAVYLAHHGRATCVDTDPLCHICPLRSDCPFPRMCDEEPEQIP